MTTFAQKDYSSKIGDSEHTVAEAGSLLTAIANLLSRFGYVQDPASLASRLESMEVDPAKLTWGHVSLILPEVGVFKIDNGAPQYSDSIVVFNHNNRLSYAAVADASAQTVIDSFDGEEKDWALYGEPKMYVTFVKYQTLEVTPLVLAAPAPAPEETVADVSETGDSDTENETSIVDVTTEPTEPTAFDLTQEDELDHQSGIFADPIELSYTPNWKQTLKTGLGAIEGVAKKDAIIHDLDGEQEDKKLAEGTIVPIAGRFIKDGQPYYRTTTSTNDDHWYGIPAGILGKSERQQEDEFDHLLADIVLNDEDEEDLSGRERLIKSAATVEGKVLSVFKRKDKKAKEAK